MRHLPVDPSPRVTSGSTAAELAGQLIVEVERRLVDHNGPFIIAVDGRSGTGKSSMVESAAARCPDWTVIDGDSFYAGGDDAFWDSLDAEAKVAHCIDWRKQAPVLEALRRGEPGEWRGYDWDAFDGSMETSPLSCEPAAVVVLDGAYSARPELADLVDLRVLVVIDPARRRAQLLAREGAEYREEWEARWSEAEVHYFGHVMAPSAFDLVLGDPDLVS